MVYFLKSNHVDIDSVKYSVYRLHILSFYIFENNFVTNIVPLNFLGTLEHREVHKYTDVCHHRNGAGGKAVDRWGRPNTVSMIPTELSKKVFPCLYERGSLELGPVQRKYPSKAEDGRDNYSFT